MKKISYLSGGALYKKNEVRLYYPR